MAIFVAADCKQDVIPSSRVKFMRIELDIFSGRPNPSWKLTATESVEFLRQLRTLPPDGSDRSIRDNLGYRGLIVTGDATVINSFDSIIVSGGKVLGQSPQGSRSFVDKDRGLEQWLIHTGKAYLEPDIYNQVVQEIQQP